MVGCLRAGLTLFCVVCPPPQKVECGECGATVELTELGAHLEKYAPLELYEGFWMYED